jgi:hypothetical protein
MKTGYGIAACAVALALSAQAFAQGYAARPYDPPVGSRWQIVTQTDSREDREATRRDQHVAMSAELTIEQKLPDGFRIAYVNRGIEVSGNAPGTEIAAAAFQTMKDIVVHARTDRSGKPVAIENLDEIRGKMRTVVDKMVNAFQAKPQLAAVMKDMLNTMLVVDGAEAARLYIEDVPALASVQNTGLKPGEERQSTEEVSNPLGGTLRSVVTTKLTSFDAAKGTALYRRSRSLDKDALQAFVLAMVRKLQPAADGQITPQMVEAMKQIVFTMTSESVFTVEDGMTRGIVENSTIEVSLAGHTFTKAEKKTVAVTPLPRL